MSSLSLGSQITHVIPEIIIIATALALLVVDIVIPKKHRDLIGYISLFSLITALVFAIIFWTKKSDFILNTLNVDDLSTLIRVAIIVVGITINLVSIKNTYAIQENQGEFFSLLLFSISGTIILAGARDMITLYIGLELSTIPTFILVAFRKARLKAGEALVKFFVLGLLSSAFLLYGLSLVYGLSGSLDLSVIAKNLTTNLTGGKTPALAIASLFIIAGFGFKITAIPFHFWAPDTYEGAPVVVVSYLSSVSKLGAFAIIGRFFIEALLITQANWALWFGALAAITMTLGNLMALPQSNIKRMMAYSGIGHAGYLLVGLAVGTNAGIGAMYFYLIAYVFAAVGVFSVIAAHSTRGESDAISGYLGTAQTNPVLALVLLFFFLSLIGIPPFAGLFGKLYLANASVSTGQWYLAVLIFVNSVISFGFYGKVIRAMYLKDPDPNRQKATASVTTSIALAISVFAIIYLGVVQQPVLRLAGKIFATIKL